MCGELNVHRSSADILQHPSTKRFMMCTDEESVELTSERLGYNVQRMANRPASFQFSLRTLFVGMLCISILFGIGMLCVRGVQNLRRAAIQMQCQNNLKQLALALENYREVYKTLPCVITYSEDGTPLHSWRVPMIPFFEMSLNYTEYDYREPWNGPSNNSYGSGMPNLYRCPSAPPEQDWRCTNYVMLIDDRPGKPNGPPNLPGSTPPCLDPGSAVIVIEIADSDIHWTEPRDVLLSELSMKINDRSKRSLSSYHGGACVLHANGTVEVLDPTETKERVRQLLAQ